MESQSGKKKQRRNSYDSYRIRAAKTLHKMTRKTRKFEYEVLEKILNSNIRKSSVRNFEYTEIRY
jgi:hypothetical protein